MSHNKINMFRLMTTILALATSLVAWSEEAGQLGNDPVLTLEEALNLSKQKNLEIRNAELEVEKAVDTVEAAETRRMPKLEVRAMGREHLTSQGYTFNRGAFGDFQATGPIPAQDTTINSQSDLTGSVSASVILPLTQQFRIGADIEQTVVARDIAQQQLRARRQNVEEKVKHQYYSILQTQSALEATEESIVYYRSLQQLVDRYVEEQVALQYESMEVTSRLAKAEHKAYSQLNTLKTEQEKLNELLGQPLEYSFRVSAVPATSILTASPEEATDEALSQRPDINEARLKVEHEKLGREIKQLEYIPNVDLKVYYAKFYNVDLIPDQEATVGLHANWEFYDWGRKQSEISKKNKAIMQAKNELRLVEQKVVVEVHSRIRKLQEARDQIQVAAISRDAAREKLRVITNRYREKAVLLQDALHAESELAKANNEYNQSVLSLWDARANLEKALGEG